MAEQNIIVPNIGDFKEVEVIEVLVKEGQTIKKNESVITLESDKSSVEVPSTHSGKIGKINVSVGDKINKSDLILTLESSEKKEEIKKEEPKESKVEAPVPAKEITTKTLIFLKHRSSWVLWNNFFYRKWNFIFVFFFWFFFFYFLFFFTRF